jgi:hypothetical protein
VAADAIGHQTTTKRIKRSMTAAASSAASETRSITRTLNNAPCFEPSLMTTSRDAILDTPVLLEAMI